MVVSGGPYISCHRFNSKPSFVSQARDFYRRYVLYEGVMHRDDILRALREMANVLSERGIAADIYIIDGASIVVAYNPERETKDMDAVSEPKREVREAAKEVARRLHLPQG